MKFSLLKSSKSENSKIKNDKQKNTNTLEKDSTTINNSILTSEINYDNKKLISKKYDCSILNKDIIEFVAQNFPEASSLISNSLMDLKNTIENSIDIIEDISSKIIKDERNFNLSSRYRDTSISLYGISKDIECFINWMNDLQKNNIDSKTEDEVSFESFSNNLSDELIHNRPLSFSNNSNNELNIFSDFTDIMPKAFIIDFKEVIVDDWNDLVIKTADSLIKIYRSSNESSSIEIEVPELSSKKSFENEFRDTIIEMLIEYNIEPSRYKVIVN